MTLITRPLRLGAVAAAALLGTVAMAGAQQAPDKERQPLARDKGSEGKELRGPPGVRQEPGTDQPKAGQRPDMDRAKGAERPEKDRAKGAQRPDADKDRPKGAARPDADKDRPKGAARPDADKDRPKGAARPDADKDRSKGAEAPGKDKGTRLSQKQRSEVGAKLRQNRVERTSVHVNVRIGAPVPRSIRLHPLPDVVLVSVPRYRGHSYFVQDDGTIVIVDTGTYVVVEVISSSTRAAGLSLTPEQMRLVYTSVPRDRVANVRVRLALGAEVPAHVRLLKFPGDVRARIPELHGYRYIVAGRDVVIVDPQDRDIALVIGE